MNSSGSSLIHSNILDRFARLNANGRLAHAYLFIGPKGIGKSETAREVAKLVNCTASGGFKPGCACESCRKIDAGSHPDIYIVRREEEREELRTELIRDLMERFSLRVWEGRARVGIIVDANEMNAVSQSVFLKTLEEPSPRTLLILTTSQAGLLLPTIVSRCQPVHFFPLGDAELADQIKSEYHVGSVEASILARFGEGSPGRSRELGSEFLKKKNAMIDRFVFSRDGDGAIKAYCADRDSAREFLGVLLAFFRDVALMRRGTGPEFLVNADRAPEIKRLGAKYSDDDVDQILAQTLMALRGVGEYMNVKVSVTLLKEMI
jgi:DNA polymerase-3 subunit delta'